MLRRIRQTLLRIDPQEVSFERRNFYCKDEASRKHLERVGRSFLHGYHAATTLKQAEISTAIDSLPLEFRGFGFEGAAMSLALLDSLVPLRKRRWTQFLGGPGATHQYVMHVGFGWAMARVPWLRWRLKRQLASFDPLLRWLVIDGFGFHEGYFHWNKWRQKSGSPPFAGYLGRAFDQGLGRSLWFVCGSDVQELKRTISEFGSLRVPDLWSGVGLAAAYSGGANKNELSSLVQASGEHRDHLAQGATFAAEARMFADNPSDHTDLACKCLCGLSAFDAALITRATRGALRNLRESAEQPIYEIWRTMIRHRLEEHTVCAI